MNETKIVLFVLCAIPLLGILFIVGVAVFDTFVDGDQSDSPCTNDPDPLSQTITKKDL